MFAYTGCVTRGTFSGLPHAWVVRCKKCTCTITCCAVNPQTEHAEPEKSEPAGARHLFLLLDGISLQRRGGIQRTAVAQ